MAVFSLGDISMKAFLGQGQLQTLKPAIHMGTWSAHSSHGHATSRSGGGRKGFQFEENEEQFADWAEHWPFPEFEAKPPVKSVARDAADRLSDGNLTPHDVHSNSSDEVTFVRMVKPHPLSSDWNLAYSGRKRETSEGRSPVEKSTGVPHGRERTVTKDELTALIATYDAAPPLGGRLQMSHMDLSWIAGKPGTRIVLPSLHLNLSNVAAALESGTIKDRQILVNSPRSAIILARHGVTLDELKRDPLLTSNSSTVANRPSSASGWAQKKRLAVEEIRRIKLEQLVAEYREVCENVSLDAIVAFCNMYDHQRPCSALHIEFSLGVPQVVSTVRSPERKSLLIKLDRSQAALIERQRRARNVLHQSELSAQHATVVRGLQREQRAATVLDHKRQQHRARREISAAKAELWRSQHDCHDRLAHFHRLISSQRTVRRLDEVAMQREDVQREATRVQESIRLQATSICHTKANEERHYLRVARSGFLKYQR